MPGRSVAEVQADPEFQALSPAAQEKVLARIREVAAAGYTGAPDLPLEPGLGDVSDQTAGTMARVAGPMAGALLGPPGFLASLGTAAAVGGGSRALGNAAEGKPFDAGDTALGALTNAATVPASRILGALGGVAGAKLGLTPKVTGALDLSTLRDPAAQAAAAKGLVGGRVSAAGETIKDMLDASGGSLPVHAPGLAPSAELVRKGIPYRQPGGKELYGLFREAAKANPAYDKLLQQYRATHALTDIPSMKEFLTAMAAGGAGLGAGGTGGLLAVLLPRLFNAARFAPPAPMLQAGMGITPGLLEALQGRP